jgi:hypothetical protein
MLPTVFAFHHLQTQGLWQSFCLFRWRRSTQQSFFWQHERGEIAVFIETIDDSRRNRSAVKAETVVGTDRVHTTSSIARSALSSPMRTENVQKTKLDQGPFNGYYFRILTSQGPHAPGGAKNYVVDGNMTEGFAFVAYPAEYRSSGLMTFIVNESGTIYEEDLGPNTTKLAEAMTTFDPDSTWRQAE